MPLFEEREQMLHLDLKGSAQAPHKPVWAGLVAEVLDGSPALMAGIRPGDLISAVNGRQVQDVIDVQFFAADDQCLLTVHRDGRALEVAVEKDIDRQLGIVFKDDLFDGVRLCSNRCDFCFVDQQPSGMRETLGIRDDDFRLSFLHGNFVTLTNLTDQDWERIFEQRLSPLYISVHATNTDIRRRLLRNKKARDVMEDIGRLIAGGIRVHTQVVLCEGLNDGETLDQTIEELSRLYPEVESLAVVPMGVTDYRLARNVSKPYDKQGCRRVLRQIRRWQKEFEKTLGVRFVIPSDEFYLVAEKPLPKSYTYGDYPQLSNGVGGARLFLDEVARLKRMGVRGTLNARIQFVTGTLAAPLVQVFADVFSDLTGCHAQVVAAENNWYGKSVTVAGLLTGRDVRDALNKSGHADLVVIPDIMMKDGGELLLDDSTASWISRETGKEVVVVPSWPLNCCEKLRMVAGF